MQITQTMNFSRLSSSSRAILRSYSAHAISKEPPLLLQLKDHVKQAMRNKDKVKLTVLKDVLAQVVNASKTNKPVETDSQLLTLIRSSISKRQESASSFTAHHRHDLAEQEITESTILESYIPQQMDERELQAIIIDLVASISAGPKDIGKVLSALSSKVDVDRAPKSLQSKLVRQVLGSGPTKD